MCIRDSVTAADIFGRQICSRHVRGHVADMTASCPRTWRRHCFPINASTYYNVTCHTIPMHCRVLTGAMKPSVACIGFIGHKKCVAVHLIWGRICTRSIDWQNQKSLTSKRIQRRTASDHAMCMRGLTSREERWIKLFHSCSRDLLWVGLCYRNSLCYVFILLYTVSQKTIYLTFHHTFGKVDRFSTFFYCQIPEKTL